MMSLGKNMGMMGITSSAFFCREKKKREEDEERGGATANGQRDDDTIKIKRTKRTKKETRDNG